MKLVFVSSTFKDMQFERDKLNTYVVPLIDSNIAQYGEQIFFSDLRWGVNTSELDEQTSNKKVLDVCLDEIDNCKPYMIVLIGERYGWIPSKELIKQASIAKGIDVNDDISVTQLEIEYGALLNPDYEGRILFYFRNLDKEGMSDDERKDYEAESSFHKEKLELLKEKIIEKYPSYVRYYNAKWDKDKKEVINLDSLTEMIINDLNKILIEDINKDNNMPWQQKTLNAANSYYLERSKDYYPITTYDKEELVGALINKKTHVSFIEGNPGSGKTSFLANMYSYLYNRASDDILIVPYVCQLDRYCNDSYNFFKVLLYKLEEKLNISHQELEFDCDYDINLIYKIKELLAKFYGNVLCFIDNCDEPLQSIIFEYLYNPFNDEPSSYIEIEPENSNLYFYIAYSSNEPEIILPPNFNFARTFKMLNLTNEEKVDFIKNLVKRKHKELPVEVIKHISKKQDSHLVLYNKLIVDRLLLLDSQDFSNIRKLGDGMDNINKYMIEIIDNLADDVDSIIQELVKEASERINKEFVYRLCGVLIYSSIGLTKFEIMDIFKFNNWEFNQLDFSITVKTLSTFIEYLKLNELYKIRNFKVISAIKQLLEQNNYKYVCDGVCNYIDSLNEDSIISQYNIRAASYKDDLKYLSKVLLKLFKNDEYLTKEVNWLLKHYGSQKTGEFFAYLVKNYPNIDFSPLLYQIPTTCLFNEEYHQIVTFIAEILNQIDIDKRKKENINYNSFVFLAIYKLIMLFNNNVSFSSAYVLYESFGLFEFEDYKMSELVKILIYKISIEMNVGICNVDNSLEYIYEDDNPIYNIDFNKESKYQNYLLRGHILYQLSKKYSTSNEYDKYYYQCLDCYFQIDKEDTQIYKYLTVDDFKLIIDAYLCKMKEDFDADSTQISITNALYYLKWGYELFGNRLLKCYPDIYKAINCHLLNIDENSMDVNKIIPYLKKQVANRTYCLNDYVDAINENCLYLRTFAYDLEENYDSYFEQIYQLLNTFYKEITYSFDTCFLNVFYNTCYMFTMLYRSNLQEKIDELLSLIECFNDKDIIFYKDTFNLFKQFLLCFFKENINLKEAKNIEKLYNRKMTSKYTADTRIYEIEFEFIKEALEDYNFKDNYIFDELVIEDNDEDEIEE